MDGRIICAKCGRRLNPLRRHIVATIRAYDEETDRIVVLDDNRVFLCAECSTKFAQWLIPEGSNGTENCAELAKK